MARSPHIPHGRRPGFPGALAFAVLLSVACHAEIIGQNLQWRLCQYGSIDGNILTVDVPESATNRTFVRFLISSCPSLSQSVFLYTSSSQPLR